MGSIYLYFQASTLRYELDLNKKSVEQLRKKQMSDSSQLEKEYIEKIAKLEKIIETQRSEIEFKVTSLLIDK